MDKFHRFKDTFKYTFSGEILFDELKNLFIIMFI